MEYWGDLSKYNSKSDIHDDLYRDRNQFNRLFNIRLHYGDGKSIAERYCDSIAFNDLYKWFIYIDGEWRNFVSMEHRSDNSKHQCESDFNNNLFSNRNKFQRLLKNR